MKYVIIAGVLILIGAGLFFLSAREARKADDSLPQAPLQEGVPAPAPSGAVQSSGAKAPATAAPVGNQGKVVFGIKDRAVSLGDIAAINISVKEVMVHGAEGWVSVSKAPKTYDLVFLHSHGAMEFLAEANLEAGTYQQIRLIVDKVLIAKKGEAFREAKLPSGDIKLAGLLVIEKGRTSGVVVDFLGDKSVHITGSGQYIFSPVIRLDTRTEAAIQRLKQSETFPNGLLEIFGGLTKFSGTFAMDGTGAMKLNGEGFGPWENLEIQDGKIKILSSN